MADDLQQLYRDRGVGGTIKKYGKAITETETVTAAAPPSRRRRGATARKGRTKTPAGTRWIQLPPSIAVFYEMLMDRHTHPFVFTTPEDIHGGDRTSANGYWRPVWDGVHADNPSADDHVPAILP